LLYALKAVDDRAVHKNVRDAKASGKSSFAWAWVMDSRPEERERGVTIDVSMKRCVLDAQRTLVVLDAPGHRDFVPSAISGAAQADVGVLVIDGSVGGFETGFESTPGHNGQTREHARLAKALGLSTLVIAVNKMDTVAYDFERFQHVMETLKDFLVSDVKFALEQLVFVPVSGIEGANISPDDAPLPEDFASWYHGPTLVDALRAIRITARGEPKPLRLPIADIVTEVRSLGGAACGGKIEAGSLVKGQKIMLMPANVTATVKVIEVDGIAVDFAPIGTTVDVGLSDIDPIHLQVGSVLCHASYPMLPTNDIEVCVLATDMLRVPLLKGSKVVLHSHMIACDATIMELMALVDTMTGAVIKSNPRCITRDQSAILRVRTSKNICVEPTEVSPTLSRITMRMNGKTVALGAVTALWR
jgi:elongation factor 1 alpha-like protein